MTLISFVFAQNGEIVNLQFEKNESNVKPQIIRAQIQVDAASSDGLFVELPKGLTAVIRAASLNDNALWLINSEKEIEKNNVLGWQLKDNGIVLHYSSDFSGQLDIEIAPDSARLNRLEQVDINIHQVTRNNEQLAVENAVVAKSNLIIKQNTLTDEE